MTSCSYSVQSNYYYGGTNTQYQCRGGYTVTIDNSAVATCSAVSNNNGSNVNASDTHKFFVSNIGLTFTTGTASGPGKTATGSGSMKYILGSWFTKYNGEWSFIWSLSIF